MFFFCLQVDGPINERTYELGIVIGSLKFSFHIFQGSGLFNLGHFLKGERFVTYRWSYYLLEVKGRGKLQSEKT